MDIASPEAPAADQPRTFGSRLAARRKALGLTQEQLGHGLGPDGADLGKGAISAWEVDRAKPNVQQLASLCQRLRCSADDLLGIGPDSIWR